MSLESPKSVLKLKNPATLRLEEATYCLEFIPLLQYLHVLITGNHPAALDLVTEEAISQPTGPLTHLEVRVKGYGSNLRAQILPIRKDLKPLPAFYKLRET